MISCGTNYSNIRRGGLHITLYFFEHRAPQVEVAALNQMVEAQANTMRHMEKTCKHILSRVNSLTDIFNRLGNK